MALCSLVSLALVSLAFREKRPPGPPWRVAENLNYPNYLRGPDGQAFPLPSNFCRHRTTRNQRWIAQMSSLIATTLECGRRRGGCLVPGMGNAAIPAQGRLGKAKRQPLRASTALTFGSASV